MAKIIPRQKNEKNVNANAVKQKRDESAKNGAKKQNLKAKTGRRFKKQSSQFDYFNL